MNEKNVAIIGAGPGGLSAAKYALENGLTPFIYDKASEIGGLWSKGTAMWEGLHANASRFILSYADHQWPRGSCIFPSREEVQEYLISYAERFNLNKHIYLNHTITRASKLSVENTTKWELEFENGDVKVFDFLTIASGLHSKPKIPDFKNLDHFEGFTLHSSQFQLKHPELKDKKVIVIGCCYSGSDISANLVGHAREVVNVFTRPYFMAPRLVATQLKNNKYSILPIDFIDYNRKLAYIGKDSELSDEEKRQTIREYLKTISPLQIEKGKLDPSLYIDVDELIREENAPEIVISITDTYIESVVSGKIKPIRSGVKEVTKNGLILNNGSFESADVILFATGYDCSSIKYLDKSVIDVFKVDTDYLKFQYALGKFTFHPDLDNFALIGQLEGLYYNGSELQGKLAALVFSEKLKLDKEELRREVNEIREQIKLGRKEQFPYGAFVEICDKLANEMKLLPDFEEMKESNPSLYRLFWDNLTIASQWIYKQNPELVLDLMNEIDKVYLAEYELEGEIPSCREKATQFNKLFKYQTNFKV